MGIVPVAPARNCLLEKLRQFWDPKALGQHTRSLWSLHPVWDPLGPCGGAERVEPFLLGPL